MIWGMFVWLSHRVHLDGTPSLSVSVVVVYGVIIDDGWFRPKWHALHVVLCREAARLCVCADGVKVKEWRQRVAPRLQVVMVVLQPFRLRQLKG